jgi:RNA polymerase sigma factor (sigma-70 family)
MGRTPRLLTRNRSPSCRQRGGVGTELAIEPTTTSDAQLIARSLRDPEAFVAVFERHFDAVQRYARGRAEPAYVDDVVADTFETAFRRRADYDTSRPTALPWLLGIAINQIRRRRREERTRARLLPRLFVRDEAPAPARDSFGAARLRALLAGLREEDRDLLLLYACVELTYEECAEALGLPVGTVRSRLHRSRARLRAELERHGRGDE